MLTKRNLFVCLLAALLFLGGCSSSQVVASLGLVVSAAEAALPIISASSGGAALDPTSLAKALSYLHAVNQAVTQAAAILSVPGTTQQHAVKIAAAFASVAHGCNCLPPGTPSNILAVIDGVVRAVENFLVNFPSSPSASSPSPSASPAPQVKISGADKAELLNIQRRAELQVLAVDAVKTK
jgi:hypothetical protein